MTTITSLTRTSTPATAGSIAAPGLSTPATSNAGGASNDASTIVALGGGASSAGQTPALMWENRNHSTVASLMAQNIGNQPLSGRFQGLGADMLRQVAYDDTDLSQTVQLAPSGVQQSNTYDMLVSPTQANMHGMGDNQVSLTVTTRSGTKVELSLDATDNGIAVAIHSSDKLTGAEQKALGKLADAFQHSIDALTEDPPRVDLTGLTQFDTSTLSAVDLKAKIKQSGDGVQQLDFHADSKSRSVNLNGPAGTAQVNVDLSQPASWGDKAQQAKALNNYLQQVDQEGQRGHANADMLKMFKDAFTDMNSDYGTPPAAAPSSIYLTDQDKAMTTGLADFSASVTQTEVSSNPRRMTEKDTFSYDLSQKTSIAGSVQMDRSISQQQQSHLKANYHEALTPNSPLKLDLRPESQNYKYVTINDSASSTTNIAYDQGALAKATLEMTASRSIRVLSYSLAKLQSDKTTPSMQSSSRDLRDTLDPRHANQGTPDMNAWQRQQMLTSVNNRIFLQSDPSQIVP